jgi:4-azaleucine resistance transporter AzlC
VATVQEPGADEGRKPARRGAGARFFEGARACLPVVMGYLAVGFAFGVVARTAGLSVLEVGMMSLVLYAGSAQFAAVGMLAASAAAPAIIVTIFLVNVRHLLYSAALSPLVRRLPTWQAALLGAELTDETFAVASLHLGRGQQADAGWLFGLNATAQGTWILATVTGAVAGHAIPNTRALGLDFALASMFAALLVLQIVRHPRAQAAIVAGALAAAIAIAGPSLVPASWAIIAAALVGATAGLWLEERSLWT